jgi:hypothetical protein
MRALTWTKEEQWRHHSVSDEAKGAVNSNMIRVLHSIGAETFDEELVPQAFDAASADIDVVVRAFVSAKIHSYPRPRRRKGN